MRIFRRLAITIVCISVVAVALPWCTVHFLSRGRIFYDARDIPSNDVAMVMGAAVWNGEPSPILKKRLDKALDLWNSDTVKAIIVSGSTSDNEPETMRNYLISHGVEPEAIVMDEKGDNSYASCARAISTYGVDKLTIITQSYHAPRTIATCRLVGIDAIALSDHLNDSPQLRRYQRRELGANIKMIVDVLTRRQVGQDETSDEVKNILSYKR